MKIQRAFTLLIIFVSFTSCHKTTSPLQKGGSLKIGIFHQLAPINPLTTDSTFAANLLDLTHSSLIRLDGHGTAHPELAKSWSASQDGLTITFNLRNDIRFHNGEPLTAEDIKFCYLKFIQSKNAGYSQYFINVKKIEAEDPQTIKIQLTQPDSTLWMGLSLAGIGPKKLLENDAEYRSYNKHPVGSGPYEFVKQDATEVVLKANEKYFDGRPPLDQIIVKIYPGQESNLNHLLAGDIDMIFLLNPNDYGSVSQIPSLRVYENWYPLLYLITFNMKNIDFESSITRQALNYAIDKNKLIEKALQGKGQLASVSVPPADHQYDPELNPYPYDPQKALNLLHQAGWAHRNSDHLLVKNNKTFSFTVDTIEGEDLNSQILNSVQKDLRELGIEMKVRFLSFDDYVKKIYREKKFEANISYFVFRSFYDNNFSL